MSFFPPAYLLSSFSRCLACSMRWDLSGPFFFPLHDPNREVFLSLTFSLISRHIFFKPGHCLLDLFFLPSGGFSLFIFWCFFPPVFLLISSSGDVPSPLRLWTYPAPRWFLDRIGYSHTVRICLFFLPLASLFLPPFLLPSFRVLIRHGFSPFPCDPLKLLFLKPLVTPSPLTSGIN